MASKKTGKKKGRKKARTAAQKAATARLVAMNKGKKKAGKKKSRKKKGSKKKAHKKGWRQHSVGRKPTPRYHSNLSGPYVPHKRYKPSVGEQFAGERGGGRFHGPVTPTQALAQANREIARLKASGGHKKKRHSKKAHKHSGKHSGVITAASILKGAKSQNLKLYVCAGKKFTGCGGGKKGAHVVGHLRG
jgi:hypothetical protein